MECSRLLCSARLRDFDNEGCSLAKSAFCVSDPAVRFGDVGQLVACGIGFALAWACCYHVARRLVRDDPEA